MVGCVNGFNDLKLYLFVFHNTDTFYLPVLLTLVLFVIITIHLLLGMTPPKKVMGDENPTGSGGEMKTYLL